MSSSGRAINRVFTHQVISELVVTGSSNIFNHVVQKFTDKPEGKTVGDLIREIYVKIKELGRNEYYYKNTLLNNLICGVHSVNTTTALSQLRIAKSIADFVLINGEGKAYEIKSDLDNFDRLEGQLRDYYKAFSKVSVIVPEFEFDRVNNILSKFSDIGDYVGVYVLSSRDTLSKKLRREPSRFTDLLSHESIFKLLRKYEYESVLTNFFGEIPIVKPVFHFKTCLEEFYKIPIEKAQQLAFDELKLRIKIKKLDFNNVQKELKSLVYFSELSQSIGSLNAMLETQYKRI